MPCIMLICMLQIHWAFDTTNIIYQKINNFISILTRQMNQSVSCCLQILIVYSFLESWFPWIVWLCPTAAIAYIIPFYLVSLYIFSFFLFLFFICLFVMCTGYIMALFDRLICGGSYLSSLQYAILNQGNNEAAAILLIEFFLAEFFLTFIFHWWKHVKMLAGLNVFAKYEKK